MTGRWKTEAGRVTLKAVRISLPQGQAWPIKSKFLLSLTGAAMKIFGHRRDERRTGCTLIESNAADVKFIFLSNISFFLRAGIRQYMEKRRTHFGYARLIWIFILQGEGMRHSGG